LYTSTILQTLLAVFCRDLRLAFRRKTDTLSALFFFILVVSLFPLAIGPETLILKRIAPGVIWVSALLSSMLTLPKLFSDDASDGTLEQLLLSHCPLSLLVLAKISAHWVCSGLVLVSISPLLAIQFNLGQSEIMVLVGTLLIGTPILSLIGSIAGALTIGLKSSGALISLITLPLLIPVLIMGTAAIDAVSSGTEFFVYFYLLGAYFSLCVFFVPLASAFALRITLD